MIRSLRDEGVAILFVSTSSTRSTRSATRMTVLRNGTFQGGSRPPTSTRRRSSPRWSAGDEGARLARTGQQPARGRPQRRPVYRAEGLGRKGSLEPRTSRCTPAEVLGIAGLLGSGRTELARLVWGRQARGGHRAPRGRGGPIASPSQALAARIAYASENRRDEGIIRDLSVREPHPRRPGEARLGPPDPAQEERPGREVHERAQRARPTRTGRSAISPAETSEGPAGTLARDPARRADPRRADPRHRHRPRPRSWRRSSPWRTRASRSCSSPPSSTRSCASATG